MSCTKSTILYLHPGCLLIASWVTTREITTVQDTDDVVTRYLKSSGIPL